MLIQGIFAVEYRCSMSRHILPSPKIGSVIGYSCVKTSVVSTLIVKVQSEGPCNEILECQVG